MVKTFCYTTAEVIKNHNFLYSSKLATSSTITALVCRRYVCDFWHSHSTGMQTVRLRLLAQSQHWYADGTFKTVPPLFTQLYTIHGIFNNNIVPLIFALMSEKTEESYRMLLSKLKQLQPSLRPISVMTDFETATVKASSTSLLEYNIEVVFFISVSASTETFNQTVFNVDMKMMQILLCRCAIYKVLHLFQLKM